MKKFLWVVGVLVVVLGGAVLVGPGLIDWNTYKSDIQAQVRSATGRDVRINGDISLTVLPSPALIVQDVSLANIDGAQAKKMLSLKSLEVRVALAPLLGGQVKVERIKLVNPVFELEALADGRRNWTFAPAPTGSNSGATTSVPPAPGSVAGAAPDAASSDDAPPDGGFAAGVALDNVSIENGTVIYRDASAGTFEKVDAINATFSAASLKGPFESTGGLTARGLPLNFNLNVGEIIHGRTVAFNLRLGIARGDLKMQMNGTLVGLGDVPRVKGSIKGEAKSLATLIQAAQPVGLPKPLGQAFSFEASIAAGADGAEIKGLELRLGETRASGGINMKLGKVISIAVRLAAGRIDLDKWLVASEIPAPAPVPEKSAKSGSSSTPAAGSTAVVAKRKGPPSFFIPKFVHASLALTAEAATYRGEIVRSGVLNAELANGEVTVSQLSAQFPGGSDMALFGFVTAVDGKPRFEGELESTVNDMRAVLNWLGTDINGVAKDRLRKMTLATRLIVVPEQAQLTG
ncbi:MAG: AsmA family protein, partial [Alphaproteobacteria bacterium]|nr:AsmA family protein [Alphaproteobacteria bacterium]